MPGAYYNTPFGEAIFWVLRKLFSKRSDAILGHSASIVEKRAPRSLLAQRHTVGGGPGQFSFYTRLQRVCQSSQDTVLPPRAWGTLPYSKTQEPGVQALTFLPQTHHISNSECEPHTYTAGPLRRPVTQQRWLHHTWQGGEGCSALITKDLDPGSEHCKMSQVHVVLANTF